MRKTKKKTGAKKTARPLTDREVVEAARQEVLAAPLPGVGVQIPALRTWRGALMMAAIRTRRGTGKKIADGAESPEFKHESGVKPGTAQHSPTLKYSERLRSLLAYHKAGLDLSGWLDSPATSTTRALFLRAVDDVLDAMPESDDRPAFRIEPSEIRSTQISDEWGVPPTTVQRWQLRVIRKLPNGERVFDRAEAEKRRRAWAPRKRIVRNTH